MQNRLAFNGISLPQPDDADLVSLDARRIKLSLPEGGALDLQWQPLTGNVPLVKQLRKVAKAHKSGDFWELDSPLDFESPYQQHWFAWKNEQDAGLGVVLDSPHMAAVARLVGGGRDALADVAGSLTLHEPDEPTPWSVFGLTARTPPHLLLTKHAFQPGKYQLELARKAERLTLSRYAPAEVVLAGKGVEAWSEAEFAKPIRKFDLRQTWEGEHLWFRPKKSPTGLTKLASRLAKRPAWGALAVWQCHSSLLAVQAQSITEPAWLADVVHSYAMVPPKKAQPAD